MWILCGAAGVADPGADDPEGGSKQRVVRPEAAHPEGGLLRGYVDIVE